MRISADCIDQEYHNDKLADHSVESVPDSVTLKMATDVSLNNETKQSPSLFNDRVKVIYRVDTNTNAFVPLTLIPVDKDSDGGYYTYWDEIKEQVLGLNFNYSKDIPKDVTFSARIGDNLAFLPLNNEDDYSTALKVAELCNQPLDIIIKLANGADEMSHNDNSSKGAIPKRRLLNVSDGNEMTKKVENDGLITDSIDNSSQSDKSTVALSSDEIIRLKEEITSDVTRNIVKTLINCLSEFEKSSISTKNVPQCEDENDLDSEAVCNDTKIAPEIDMKCGNDANDAPVNGNETKDHDSKLKGSNDDASNPVVHYGIICDHCENQIQGIRYKCNVCNDYDLCETCEQLTGIHDEHPFLKIKKPIMRCKRNGDDIFMTVDIDMPTGKINIGDIRVVPKKTEENTPSESRASHHQKESTKCKMSDRKVKKITKKLEKLRAKGQVFSTLLQNINDDRSVKSDQKSVISNGSATNKAVFLSGMFVSDETVPEGTKMPPGTKFKKTWKVRNTGSKVWTPRTTLRFVWGSPELETYDKVSEVQTPPLRPGEEGRISISFIAPKTNVKAFFQSHWRLHHRGQPFGQRLICKVIVDPSLELNPPSLTLNRAVQLNKQMKCNREKVHGTKHLHDALTAVKETRFNLNDNDPIPMKLNVKSHTATPANTPFDVSPPKSPEPQNGTTNEDIFTSEIRNVVPEPIPLPNVTNGASNIIETEEQEESASIYSLSSSDSECADEFVVVPLPRCFDLNIPFVEHEHIMPVTVDNGSGDDNDANDGLTGASSFEVMTRVGVDDNKLIIPEIVAPIVTNANDDLLNNDAPIVPQTTTIEIEDDTAFATCTFTAPQNEIVDEIPVENCSKNDETQIYECGIEEPKASAPPPETEKKSPSTNPFRDSRSENDNIIHVLPEGLVTGALSAAADVYNTVRHAFFPQNENQNDFRHYAWVTTPPPAAIPLPDRYWDPSIPLQTGSRRTWPPQYRRSPNTNPAPAPETAPAPAPATATASVSIATEPVVEQLVNPQKRSNSEAMIQLHEMGFWNSKLNLELLQKNNFNVNDTIEDLLCPDHVRARIAAEEVVSRQPRHAKGNGNRLAFEEFD